MKKLLLLLIIIPLLFGCDPKTIPDPPAPSAKLALAQDFALKLKNYINKDENEEDHKYQVDVVKLDTNVAGHVVLVYYNSNNHETSGVFLVANLTNYTTTSDLEPYWEVDSLLFEVKVEYGSNGLPNGNFYRNYSDDMGNEVEHRVFESGNDSIKDLETMAAKAQANDIDGLSAMLASSYGLSEERSEKVARVMSSYNKIASKRTITEADMKAFSTEVLGTDLSKLQKAMAKAQTGDSAEYDSLIENVASTNGVSPEQAKSVLQTLL